MRLLYATLSLIKIIKKMNNTIRFISHLTSYQQNGDGGVNKHKIDAIDNASNGSKSI